MRSDRRKFLALLASAATAAAASSHNASGAPAGPAVSSARRTADPFASAGRSRVAVVGGRRVGDMVREAVSRIGGFGSLALRGKSVLVKPNVVGANAHPTTTNPAVVAAVVGALYEAGAAKVYVGDMSALIRGSTEKNMERIGILAAVRASGAEAIFFEDHGWVDVKVQGAYLSEVPVSEWIFKVDRVVNVPVVKTHAFAGYSICLKNFVGATRFTHRPYLVNPLHWEEVVAELNLAYRPDLNIVDGTKVMVEGGPWEGTAEDANLVLAGGDRVACDAVGLAIIKSYGRWERLRGVSPWQTGQVRRAAELGIGAGSAAGLELHTASLDDDPAFRDRMASVRTFL
jgi:uncharacterized protein (DUF362 family)